MKHSNIRKTAVGLLLALILGLLTAATGFAEDAAQVPDYQALLANKQGFYYDDDTHQWTLDIYYTQRYTDRQVYIGFVTGSMESSNQILYTALYADITDVNHQQLDIPVSVELKVDGDSYSLSNLSSTGSGGYAYAGENFNLLIEALASCNSERVSARIRTENDNYEFDLNPIEFGATIKDFCKTYVQLNFWENTTDQAIRNEIEQMWSLQVNGEPADYTTMKKGFDDHGLAQDLAQLELKGVRLGMTPDEIHATLGTPYDSSEAGGILLEQYSDVPYGVRPGALDYDGALQQEYNMARICLGYVQRDGQYCVSSCIFGFTLTGDVTHPDDSLTPLWQCLDFTTAILGNPEETKDGMKYFYTWEYLGKVFHMEVTFIPLTAEHVTIEVSVGWDMLS